MLLACSNMTSPDSSSQQWRLPSAVREAAVAVLVGPSRRLGHPVQRHELGHDELAHGVFLFLVATAPVQTSITRRIHR